MLLILNVIYFKQRGELQSQLLTYFKRIPNSYGKDFIDSSDEIDYKTTIVITRQFYDNLRNSKIDNSFIFDVEESSQTIYNYFMVCSLQLVMVFLELSSKLSFGLYQLNIMADSRLQKINEIIKDNKGKINLHQLENKFGTRLTSKMLRKYELSNNKFIKKYQAIQDRYTTGCLEESHGWIENERKLFIWFSILFCNHLNKNYDELTTNEWQTLSSIFFGKNVLLLRYQIQQVQRGVERVHWSQKQESILCGQIREGRIEQWNQISKRLFFETKGKYYKTAKQCREHWFNHLDFNKKKGQWTSSEDLLLLKAVRSEGRKWSIISRMLRDRRTDHMTKNRYHSLVNGVSRVSGKAISEQQIVDQLITQLESQTSFVAQQKQELIHQNQQIQQIFKPKVQFQSKSYQNGEQHQRKEDVKQSKGIFQDNICGQQNKNIEWNQISMTTNNFMNSSPYFIIMSLFSDASTVNSPFVNSWQTWNNFTGQSFYHLNQNNVYNQPSFDPYSQYGQSAI